MSYYFRRPVTITAITALTAQEIRFGADVEYLLIKNNSPINIYILDTSSNVVDVVWPGDFEEFGEEVGSSMRVYGDAVSAAADIAANLLPFFKYRLKRKR